MDFPQYTIQCPKGVYEKKIRFIEDGPENAGRVGPGDLAREMEKITEEHLETFGADRKALEKEGKTWVIAYSSISIEKLPVWGEAVIIRIWAGKKKSVMHTRKYAFYSLQGEPLVCTASLFLLMDIKSRSAAGDGEVMCGIPEIVLRGEPKTPKLRISFPVRLPNCRKRMVQSAQIDKNRHLNNACYLDWATELLRESEGEGQMIQQIWIRYSKELRQGECAEIFWGQQNDVLYAKGVIRAEESFALAIQLKPDVS